MIIGHSLMLLLLLLLHLLLLLLLLESIINFHRFDDLQYDVRSFLFFVFNLLLLLLFLFLCACYPRRDWRETTVLLMIYHAAFFLPLDGNWNDFDKLSLSLSLSPFLLCCLVLYCFILSFFVMITKSRIYYLLLHDAVSAFYWCKDRHPWYLVLVTQSINRNSI